tara:strand:- start:998 stop:1471 length:474 start_codon:yes stop_codon:yes gene_type:complete
MVVGLISYYLRLMGDADGDGEYYEKYDRDGNFLENVAVGVANDLIDSGSAVVINTLEEIQGFISNIDWEGIGTAIGKAMAYALTALRETSVAILEQTVPIVVRTIRTGYNEISDLFLEGGVEIFAAFTTGLIMVMGTIYLLRYVYHAPLAHLGLNAS